MEPNTWVDVALELLTSATDCLDQFSPSGPPDEIFLSHGPVPRFCCDYLSVHVDPIQAFTTFPTLQTVPVRANCSGIESGVTLNLRLRRDCYPRLRGNRTAPFPPAAEISQASRDLLIDARVLWCCLTFRYAAGDLFRNPNLSHLPESLQAESTLPVIWGSMTPFREASCAGWDWTITVGVPNCCALPPVASGS